MYAKACKDGYEMQTLPITIFWGKNNPLTYM